MAIVTCLIEEETEALLYLTHLLLSHHPIYHVNSPSSHVLKERPPSVRVEK
jgi:hypothetical protein